MSQRKIMMMMSELCAPELRSQSRSWLYRLASSFTSSASSKLSATHAPGREYTSGSGVTDAVPSCKGRRELVRTLSFGFE